MSGRKSKKRGVIYYCGGCHMVAAEDEDCVECESCKIWFHTECQPESINKELYKIINQLEHEKKKLVKSTCIRVSWFCDTCADKCAEKEKDLEDLKKTVKENNVMLESLVKKQNTCKMIYNEVVAKAPIQPQVKSEGVNVYLKPLSAQSKEDTIRDFKEFNKHKFYKINKVFWNNNGEAKVNCADMESSKNLEKEFKLRFKNKYDVKTPKALLPKLQLCDLVEENYLNDEDLVKAIINQNNLSGFKEIHVKVLKRFKNNKNDTTNVIIETDPYTNSLLLGRKKIFCGHQMIKVVEYIFVRKCGKCYRTTHSTFECKLENKLCTKCGEKDHMMANCVQESPKCINCHEKAAKFGIQIDSAHLVTSKNCTSYLDLVKSIKRRIIQQ